MFNDKIDEYLETLKNKPENTQKRFRNTLRHIRDKTREDVIEYIESLEQVKRSSRQVTKSTLRKFFEYLNDTEMIKVLESLSNDDIDNRECDYVFNIKQLKEFVYGLDSSNTRKLRTFLYACLLFVGVRNSDIRSIDIYEYNEETDIITHGNDVYDIKLMDIDNIIHDALVANKNARGIDYESGDYVAVAGTGASNYIKTLQGTLFMRTAMSPTGGVAANTALNNEQRQMIARSGAFIRLYNLKKKTGLSTSALFNSLDEDLFRVIGRRAVLPEYEEFERKFKEAGY